MREILFRAKGLYKDTWYYGNFVECKRNLTCEIVDLDENEMNLSHYVRRETLGQYTGLKDRNGKKIFGGDIVKLKELNYNYEWTAIIEFGNPNGEYCWGWNLKPITKSVECNTDILCWVGMEDVNVYCEVIGNVFDNPNLIKGEK